MEHHYDFVIIGSGFGGSVPAMRLTEKGYRVAVVETGKRWAAKDFAKTNWNIWRHLWFPFLRAFGPQRITFLNRLWVLRGVGVGGGSLIYANTLMKPRSDVFQEHSWPQKINWNVVLDPFYQVARRMLGVTTVSKFFQAELALKKLSETLDCAETFEPTDVGVYFGEPGQTVPDPYFDGQGPERAGCTLCGGCMVGCRHNAKNTLDKNYLYFAEKGGTRVFPETSATRITPQKNGGYKVQTRRSTTWFTHRGPTLLADKVILSAGVLGTIELLLKNRDEYKTLPNISSRLGQMVRTNGESILCTTSLSDGNNYSEGIAIGAAIHPDPKTKIESVKYSEGSSFMRLLAVPMTPDGTFITRPLKLIREIARKLPTLLRLLFLTEWARNTVILLVMQSIDTHVNMKLRRSFWAGFKKVIGGRSEGDSLPSYIPVAQEAAQKLSEQIDGVSMGAMSEVLLKAPATAHVLGGCALAAGPTEGVIDTNHEVFGYPGLYVSDGSVIPSNLAVNPSLTITALAERFSSLFPPKSN